MIEYTVKVDTRGTKVWWLNGKLHREDGPAVEYANGTKEWWLNGQLHREDGAAVEYAHGTKFWYLNGKRHREDGPAVEYADGDKEWWLHGNKLTEQEWMTQIKPQSCAGKVITIDGKKYRLCEV